MLYWSVSSCVFCGDFDIVPTCLLLMSAFTGKGVVHMVIMLEGQGVGITVVIMCCWVGGGR